MHGFYQARLSFLQTMLPGALLIANATRCLGIRPTSPPYVVCCILVPCQGYWSGSGAFFSLPLSTTNLNKKLATSKRIWRRGNASCAGKGLPRRPWLLTHRPATTNGPTGTSHMEVHLKLLAILTVIGCRRLKTPCKGSVKRPGETIISHCAGYTIS